MKPLLAISDLIDLTLKWIAYTFGWCFLANVIVICFDVVSRKFGFQLPYGWGSTPLQELQWHLHAVLFLTWIGYAYVRNAHVRIDIVTGTLSDRSQASLELFGCIFFALPYLYFAVPYAWDFFTVSFWQNESSSAPNGLSRRWIVKGFLFFGFLSVLLAVISVMIRRFVFLFGSPDDRQRAMPAAAAH
ncbi:MAG: TRAP transporter small permease subunit [Hyphomicrobiaceae bacterium]